MDATSTTEIAEAQADVAPEAEEYPPTGQAWYCVAILALAVMVNFLDRGILALLVEPIKADLGLSDVQMSLVMGFAFTFFYAIFGLPVARLVDRYSRKHILAAGVAIWGVMTAFCGLAANFWQLFLARVGVGVGETTSGPSAYSLLADYFSPQRLPRAIAGMNLGFVAGSGLAMIIGGAVIGAIGASQDVMLPGGITLRGWQVVLIVVGLPGLVVSALMLTVREPTRRGGAAKRERPLTEVFRFLAFHWPVYVPMFVGLALRTVQMFGFTMWAPAFYGRTYGWSPAQVGYVVGASLFLAMPLGLFAGSWLAERYWKNRRFDANIRVVVNSTVIAVPLAVAVPLMPSPWLAAGFGLVAAFFSSMAAPTENAALQSVTPNHLRGQMTFLFLFIMNVVGMGLGPLLIASFSQYLFTEDGIRYSIFLGALLLGPPAALVFRLGMRPYGRAMEAGGVLPPLPSPPARL
ncbi:MAG TPA: MFS transporter [Woeseiaceae bacterium]|jgi:MFS family permease|nr:MFS transporter [Woeseiaceae bacterium]